MRSEEMFSLLLLVWCELVCHSKKLKENGKSDYCCPTTLSRKNNRFSGWVNWSHFASSMWTGRIFMKESATSINKPLATKETDAVNVCPRPFANPYPCPSGLHFVNSLISCVPGPRQVKPSTRVSLEHCSGCAFTDAVLQTWQRVVKWDFSAIITRPRKKATSHSEWMPRCSSPLPVLSTGMSNHH